MKKKVIVGISGGIDSAVAALLLKENNYSVQGVYISNTKITDEKKQIINRISDAIHFPIEIVHAEDDFSRTVISFFRSQHLSGKSPSLCTYCNPNFKWKILADIALKYVADFISTGHYIQKKHFENIPFIEKGKDEAKDQSYYMWNLPDEILNRLVTPVGKFHKQDVKKIASTHNLCFLLDKKESTGLCFSENLSYPALIKKYIPESEFIKSGIIKDKEGNTIGTHEGYIYYTIGQKRGLNLQTDYRNYCVTGIDSINNTLIVGEPKELWKNSFQITDFNFRKKSLAFSCKNITAKIRGFGWNPKGYVKIEEMENQKARIILEEPAWAPAPGQTAVFYLDSLLIGGGYIV